MVYTGGGVDAGTSWLTADICSLIMTVCGWDDRKLERKLVRMCVKYLRLLFDRFGTLRQIESRQLYHGTTRAFLTLLPVSFLNAGTPPAHPAPKQPTPHVPPAHTQ